MSENQTIQTKSVWAIKYRYPGTHSNAAGEQEPVGEVYANGVSAHLTGGVSAWSYKKTAAQATHFSTQEEAESEAAKHHWPEARAIEVVFKD